MKQQAINEDRWKVYEKHVVDLSQVLRKMSLRGVRVSRELRKAASQNFEARFATTLNHLQDLVPEEIHPTKTYKLTVETLEKKGKKLGFVNGENWIKKVGDEWIGGRIREVEVMEKPKHKHSWDCYPAAIELNVQRVFCQCGQLKPSPKAFRCNCANPECLNTKKKVRKPRAKKQ